MASSRAPAQRRVIKATYAPYTGRECLEAPHHFEKKTGKPLNEDGTPFSPGFRYAVLDNTLVGYRIGRGGVHRRSITSVSVIKDGRLMTQQQQVRNAQRKQLRKQLRIAGVPGA